MLPEDVEPDDPLIVPPEVAELVVPAPSVVDVPELSVVAEPVEPGYEDVPPIVPGVPVVDVPEPIVPEPLDGCPPLVPVPLVPLPLVPLVVWAIAPPHRHSAAAVVVIMVASFMVIPLQTCLSNARAMGTSSRLRNDLLVLGV